MRNRILVIAGIAVLIIGATVFALGHGFQGIPGGRGDGPGKGHGRGFGPGMMDHIAKALDLTAEQQTQVKALFEGMHAAEEARHTKRDDLRKQLEAATANGQFDETKVRTIANEQAQLMADSMVEHERMKSKIYAILTPEQRTKAEEMHKRGGPHGRRHGPPMGAPHE
jgi:Spy/CpxP family protein refolding chaperone